MRAMACCWPAPWPREIVPPSEGGGAGCPDLARFYPRGAIARNLLSCVRLCLGLLEGGDWLLCRETTSGYFNFLRCRLFVFSGF